MPTSEAHVATSTDHGRGIDIGTVSNEIFTDFDMAFLRCTEEWSLAETKGEHRHARK